MADCATSYSNLDPSDATNTGMNGGSVFTGRHEMSRALKVTYVIPLLKEASEDTSLISNPEPVLSAPTARRFETNPPCAKKWVMRPDASDRNLVKDWQVVLDDHVL
jgi:hypothetical protein